MGTIIRGIELAIGFAIGGVIVVGGSWAALWLLVGAFSGACKLVIKGSAIARLRSPARADYAFFPACFLSIYVAGLIARHGSLIASAYNLHSRVNRLCLSQLGRAYLLVVHAHDIGVTISVDSG